LSGLPTQACAVGERATALWGVMLMERRARAAGQRRIGALSVGVLALSLLGCSTQYVERSAVTFARSQREFPAPEAGGRLTLSQWSARDEVSFRLQPAECVTRVSQQPVVEEVLERKSSLLGGPGLIVGGLAVGGLGTAGFVASRDSPESCAEGDDECFSKDEAQALSVVAWGLGAAGVVVGLYRTFKPPVELGRRVVNAGDATFTDQRGPCHVAVAGVRARLDLSTGVSTFDTTDAEGRVTFRVDGDQLPLGASGTLLLGDQRFSIDLSEIARGEPPAPPPLPPSAPTRAACDFSDLPPAQTPGQQLTQAFVDSGTCKRLLIKATEKGIDWGSNKAANKAAERMLEDMQDGWQKNFLRWLLGELLKAGANALVEDRTPRGAEAACCLLERRVRMP
jgi:hypothetical protein